MNAEYDVIWNNETGVTLSHSGNVFLEGTGSARTSMVPASSSTAGTTVTGEAVSAFTNTIDTMRGWPHWRREHNFEVNVKGADRIFFEWRGEVVADSTGFGIGGGGIPADITRIYWFSTGRCHAVGTFVDQANKSWMREPKTICYNTAQRGSSASVMAGGSQATTAQPVQAAGGFQLWTRPMGGHVGDNTNDLRATFPWAARATLPFDNAHAQGSMSQGGLLWGFTERAASVDLSRYPKQGDQYGWIYEVGYADAVNIVSPGTINIAVNAAPAVNVGPLRTSGLKKIWVNFLELAPATGVTPFWLDFATGDATMIVKGTITAVRLYEKAWF